MLNEVKCQTKKVSFLFKKLHFFSGTVSRDVFYRNRNTRLIRPESVINLSERSSTFLPVYIAIQVLRTVLQNRIGIACN
jgi:hypothetical protein